MKCTHLRQRLVDRNVDLPLACAVFGCDEGHRGVYEVRWVQWPEAPSLSFSAPLAPGQSSVESKRAWLEPVNGLWVDRMGTAILVEDHSRLLAAAQRELAETRAVLEDVLEARGESWLAKVAVRRDAIFDLARRVRCYTPGKARHGRDACTLGLAHRPDCALGEWLRVIGGPEEIQRQVDGAHAHALWELQQERIRNRAITKAGIAVDLGHEPDRSAIVIRHPRGDIEITAAPVYSGVSEATPWRREYKGEFVNAEPPYATELQTPPSGESVKP